MQRLQAANPDVLFLVQYTADATVFQGDAKRAGWSEGDRHQQRRLLRRAVAAGAEAVEQGAGWLGDPTAIDLVQGRPSWEEGQRDLQVQPWTGHGRASDARDHRPAVDGRRHRHAKSVEPAALQKAANETKMGHEQLIIDYKGVQFENGQNVLATGVVTQIGWDGEKHA